MSRYYITDTKMDGYVYGVIHDYIPFDNRLTDLNDTIIFNNIEDAKQDLQSLHDAGFTDAYIIDDNGNQYAISPE